MPVLQNEIFTHRAWNSRKFSALVASIISPLPKNPQICALKRTLPGWPGLC